MTAEMLNILSIIGHINLFFISITIVRVAKDI